MTVADTLRRIAADIRSGNLPSTADAKALDQAAADLSLLWALTLQAMRGASR